MSQMSSANIKLLITGGTIDKDYQTTSGELVFSQTHLKALLQEANCTLNVDSQVLMLKDSLEMISSDRQQIVEACLATESQQIVITHGTDTMVESALTLLDETKLAEKTIVLTGAMRPYMLGKSDASFNVATALTAVQLSRPGVYIAMNGQVFTADKVQKNRQAGLFEQH